MNFTQLNYSYFQTDTRKKLNLFVFLFPATLWLIFFFIFPLSIVLVYSFLERGTYGGVSWILTVENYQRLVNPIYWTVFFRSLYLAFLTTFACLLVGYPLAFFIATRPPQWRNIFLLLTIIPFWTNFLVRIYAWIVLLRSEGVINIIIQSLGISNEPLELLFNSFAVSVGLIYGYLPFMILPLYSTIEKFNFSLIEASHDLGANDWRTFTRIVLPLTYRGIVAGSLLVFIPAVGEFVTPDILGGAKTLMMGNLVQSQFLAARNWPFGSVLSIVMMAIVLLPIIIYFRVSEEK
ncbi:ABC transporter permease [Spirulina sp. 06S082]|uniref:ABC transporter permease n=1 Tax=Spirulina sp. 06S082 TaxID=3110248 RepID=UPI002B2084C5|nr:ABC transporter permease [Spirulina sp. 06S082]MEA5467488.1 ABC transporter permease [Spirulina sp. 06S082]